MAVDSVSGVDSFFKEQAQFGRYQLPTLIVFLASLALALQSIAVYYALGSDGTTISNAITIEFAFQMGEVVILWLLFTAAFYVLSKLAGARVRIGRLFKLTGWGFASFIPAGIAWAIGDYYAFRGLSVPEGVRVGVLRSEREAFGALVAQTQGDPVLLGITAFGCLFVLFGGYLWAMAIEYSSNLERQRAMLVAAVPPIVYIGYRLLTAVGIEVL